MRSIGLLLLLPIASFGAITYVSAPGPDTNNSIEAATRILVFGSADPEAGCIDLTAGGADAKGACRFGSNAFGPNTFTTPTQTDNQSQTRTATSVGSVAVPLTGGSMRIVFDANEPNAETSIILDAFRVLALDPLNGNLVFAVDFTGPLTLNPTQNGNGKTDAVFKLDAASAVAFDLAVNTWVTTQAGLGRTVLFGDIKLGFYANVSASSGGNESFYISTTEAFPDPVPEPSTYVLVGSGLAAIFLRRKRS